MIHEFQWAQNLASSLRVRALQSSAAKAVCDSIESTGWQKAVLTYTEIGRSAAVCIDLVFLDDHTERVMNPPRVREMKEIRSAMASATRGAWFSAVLTVLQDRSYSYDFNYDVKPDWGYYEPSIEDYLLDRERYPRPEDKFPSWYPTLDTFQAGLATDLAELAEGLDWTKITVRCVDPEEGELEVTAQLPDGELRRLEYATDLILDSSRLLGTMLRRGLGDWWAYSVDRDGNFEFSE